MLILIFEKGSSPAVDVELVGEDDPQIFGSVWCYKQVLLPAVPCQIG